ncbi:MAG: DUF559 domain-containing protein, partial [Ignavibacteriales bacterium]|nr:DUF559 domain-containing protein [Ignavibacteriales bacterium]
MSMIKSKILVEIAKQLCRENRKNQNETENIFWEKVRNRRLLNRKFYR